MSPIFTLKLLGRTVAQCDRQCYESTTPTCTCICSGLNHGKGIHRAARNTLEFVAFYNLFVHSRSPNSATITLTLHPQIEALAAPTNQTPNPKEP